MMEFIHNSQAKQYIERIVCSKSVFYGNDGIEILYMTNETDKAKEDYEKLKSIFQSVTISKSKARKIKVNRISQLVNRFSVIEVTY